MRTSSDADHLEQLNGALRGGLFVHLQVQLKRLGQLPADGEHRVEGGHRLLEDHADLVAADVPDLVLVHLEDVFAFEENLAADDLAGRVRNKPEHREGADTLAATTLTHQSENLARHDVIADAVDRLNRPLFSEKVRAKVAYLQQWFGQEDLLWQQPACVLDEAAGVIIMSHAWWGSGDSNPDALRHVILSHARLPFRHFPRDKLSTGGPPGTRTRNPLIKSQLLYRLS